MLILINITSSFDITHSQVIHTPALHKKEKGIINQDSGLFLGFPLIDLASRKIAKLCSWFLYRKRDLNKLHINFLSILTTLEWQMALVNSLKVRHLDRGSEGLRPPESPFHVFPLGLITSYWECENKALVYFIIFSFMLGIKTSVQNYTIIWGIGWQQYVSQK